MRCTPNSVPPTIRLYRVLLGLARVLETVDLQMWMLADILKRCAGESDRIHRKVCPRLVRKAPGLAYQNSTRWTIIKTGTYYGAGQSFEVYLQSIRSNRL